MWPGIIHALPCTSVSWPCGGKQRQVSVNLDNPALQAKPFRRSMSSRPSVHRLALAAGLASGPKRIVRTISHALAAPICSNKPLSKWQLTSFYVQGTIPHAFSFCLDFAVLLCQSPGPAVIPSDDRVPSERRFCAHRGARERPAVSFCDHRHDRAASPARSLVPRFRIDSVANEPRAPKCSTKAASRPRES